MNPSFGLLHVWTQGDSVARVAFAVLVAMSIASWIVIIGKALDLWRVRRQGACVRAFWQAETPAQGRARLLPKAGNPFDALAQAAQDASTQLRAAQLQSADAPNRSDWIARALRGSIEGTIGRLQRGLTILASVGSTAPFVGLFGTVWGIYQALTRISASGQAGIAEVAGPIGEALIMTALGLAAAIPAVLAYNAYVRANRNTLAQLDRFARELHTHYLMGSTAATPAAQDERHALAEARA